MYSHSQTTYLLLRYSIATLKAWKFDLFVMTNVPSSTDQTFGDWGLKESLALLMITNTHICTTSIVWLIARFWSLGASIGPVKLLRLTKRIWSSFTTKNSLSNTRSILRRFGFSSQPSWFQKLFARQSWRKNLVESRLIKKKQLKQDVWNKRLSRKQSDKKNNC